MGRAVSLIDRVQLRLQQHVASPFEHKVLAPIRRLRNASRNFRPIFVAGAAGSGTSFVAMALRERFECAGLVYEMDSQISKRSVLSVPPIGSFATLSEYRSFIGTRDSWSLDEVRGDLLNLCRSYASAPGDVVVLKGPDINLTRAGLLHRCFPDARFVLIFRDPAANIEGLRRKWSIFRDASLDEALEFYAEIHEAFLEQAEAFGDRVVGLEYEKLVSAADATFARLAESLELAPVALPRQSPASPNIEGQGLRNVRDGRIEVVQDASSRARGRLAPDELSRIESALSPIHERLRSASFTLR